MKPTSTRKKVRRQEDEKFLKDGISELPDEILVDILSALTLKEAIRTSILSKRWEGLWKFSHGKFDFDVDKSLLGRRYSIFSREQLYISWIDQVLSSHQGPTIDEFKLCSRYYMDLIHEGYINKWIGMALNKRVKHLELKLGFRDDESFSPFPHEYFSGSTAYVGAKFLVSLSLRCVRITYRMIEDLLSSCPLLEKLDMSKTETASIETKTWSISSIKIFGLSLKLKQFRLSSSYAPHSIEIFAPNLISFECLVEELNIRYAPQLQDVFYRVGMGEDHMTFDFVPLASYLSQLTSLTLRISSPWWEGNFKFPEFSELSHLRNLTYQVVTEHHRVNLLSCTSLIEASPILQRFTLEVDWLSTRRRKRFKVRCSPNPHLKEVEIVGGFDGKLVNYLLQKAINLEKIVVSSNDKREWLPQVPKVAAQFLKDLSQTTQLVIL